MSQSHKGFPGPVGVVPVGPHAALAKPRQPSGHLTERGRRVVALLALVPLVVGMLFASSHRASATGTKPTFRQVVVQQGDSLWDLAVKVAPNQDPRKTMWEIQQLNRMEDSRLIVGQALLVPTS